MYVNPQEAKVYTGVPAHTHTHTHTENMPAAVGFVSEMRGKRIPVCL